MIRIDRCVKRLLGRESPEDKKKRELESLLLREDVLSFVLYCLNNLEIRARLKKKKIDSINEAMKNNCYEEINKIEEYHRILEDTLDKHYENNKEECLFSLGKKKNILEDIINTADICFKNNEIFFRGISPPQTAVEHAKDYISNTLTKIEDHPEKIDISKFIKGIVAAAAINIMIATHIMNNNFNHDINVINYPRNVIEHKIEPPKALETSFKNEDNYKENLKKEILEDKEKKMPLENKIEEFNFTDKKTETRNKYKTTSSIKQKISILMYHLFGDKDTRYMVSYETFRKHLQYLYENNFYLINLSDYARGDFSKVPEGKKPIVLTFDDSTKNQFFFEKDGKLSKRSGLGILLDFYKQHPDFGCGGTFFVNTSRIIFGEKGREAEKLRILRELGFEIGSHGDRHINYENSSYENAIKDQVDFFKKIHSLDPQAEIVSFSWPYGAKPKDKKTLETICSMYSYVVNAWGGGAELEGERKAIPRIEASKFTFPEYLPKHTYVVEKNNSKDIATNIEVKIIGMYSNPFLYKSIKEIAQNLNVSKYQIYKSVEKNNIKKRKEIINEYIKNRSKNVKELYSSGKSVEDISLLFGMSTSTIYRDINRE